MNSSSSFDISSETLNASFDEYETETDLSANETLNFSIVSNEIQHPVKKTISKLAELSIKSKISDNAISKMVPILNEIPGASIEVIRAFTNHCLARAQNQLITFSA